jgi:alanine racemase
MPALIANHAIAEDARPPARAPEAEAPPPEAGAALLSLDLSALAQNWRRLAERAAPAECSAAIKADAYGLGLEPVMRRLLQEGCRTFFVATAREGERARAVSREAVVYVLEGLMPGAAPRLLAAGLRPVLNALAELAEWRTCSPGVPAALHFDTGMNRLGFARGEIGAAAALARDVDTSLIMSHFVAAQAPTDPANARQIAAFAATRGLFPGVPASLCNSSGLFLPQKPYFQLVRPGYALYGGNPTPRAENPMARVVGLKARILGIREIAAGETLGYDATWTAKRPTRLATLGVGYADGFPFGASSGAERPPAQALLGGVRCPFVGRVSMDLVVLDATDAPALAARRGEWAEILGAEIGVDEFAARAGTIGYEILTRLGRRHPRRYIGVT